MKTEHRRLFHVQAVSTVSIETTTSHDGKWYGYRVGERFQCNLADTEEEVINLVLDRLGYKRLEGAEDVLVDEIIDGGRVFTQYRKEG
jgi:hypothetical protein